MAQSTTALHPALASAPRAEKSPAYARRRHQPTSVGPDELDRLRQAGFDEPAALEVLEISAFFNYANRLTIALNVVPDKQFFDS
jgi:alkylhydroperoxidase family enzyme